MKERLIVLTDAFNDVDDAVALYAAIKSSDVTCTGIVTTYGDARTRAKGVSKFLRLAGTTNMPVYYSRQWDTQFHAPNEMLEIDYGFLTSTDMDADDDYFGIKPKGEAFIENELRPDNEISILSLAPLSALANAMHSVKPQDLRRIYIMGGHIGPYDDRPNANYNRARTPEYNFACDPNAARKVLESGAEIFVVGKNLWTKNLFTSEDFEFLAEGSMAQQELLRMIELRHEHNKRTLAPIGIDAELFMYDPIMLSAVLFPELYEFRKMNITVDDKGLTHTEPAEGGNLFGAVSADLTKVKKNILSVLIN